MLKIRFLSSTHSGLLPLALALVISWPILWGQTVRSKQQQQNSALSDRQLLAVLRSMPVFGNENLVADFLWLRLTQHLGDVDAQKHSSYGLAYDYLEAITKYDPYFEKAYLTANYAVAFQMGRPDLAETLLLKGVRYNSRSYLIWQYRGFLHFMYTGDYVKAAYSFRQNAGWAVAREGNAMQNWSNKWLIVAKYLEGSNPGLWLRRKVWQDIALNAARTNSEGLLSTLERLKSLGVVVDSKGNFHELYPAPMPKAFISQFVYGPPLPKE